MSSTYQIILIDQSGVQQALDFDYRHQNCKTLYNDVRSEIKKVFAAKVEVIASLFPEGEIKINVNLEQEKKDETSETLASFDSERSGDGIFVFHVYYKTISQIAESILNPSSNSVMNSFADTLLHELIHAADLSVLKESNAIREHSYKIHGGSSHQLLKDLNTPSYEWNVQWTLLHFFQIFRNEGIAMLGQHLLDENSSPERDIKKVMFRFKEVLNTVLNICTGLKYYNSIKSTEAHQFLRELSLEAYQYGDMVLIELLNTIHPEQKLKSEKLIARLSGSSDEFIPTEEIQSILKLLMQTDLSEYVQAIFNNERLNQEEPLSKQQLLECCAVIQNDLQAESISQFCLNIGICGFNRNKELFIQTVSNIIGSKMSIEEIKESYKLFYKKAYPEDIVDDIRKKGDLLVSSALNENNEVAIWALTYLLDDQDLIHDELSVLGWQDDWMLLDAAFNLI